MRIDKYLWCIRLFKTRSLATEACKKGHVKMEGNNLKPSRDIFGNELLVVRKNQINYQIKVIALPESRVGAKLVDLYRKDVTPREAFENQEFLKFAKDYYRKKGEGRPTKKDRRDIDDFHDNTTKKE